MGRPKALKLIANAEKAVVKALAEAERAVEACESDGLGQLATDTAQLLVECLRDSRDKLEHGRTRIVQSIAQRRLQGES